MKLFGQQIVININNKMTTHIKVLERIVKKFTYQFDSFFSNKTIYD